MILDMILMGMLYKPSFEYIKKEPFTGSFEGMRYRIYLKSETNEEGKSKPVNILAAVYPEPYCFEKTPDDKKEIKEFAYCREGLDEALEWIGMKQEGFQIGDGYEKIN